MENLYPKNFFFLDNQKICCNNPNLNSVVLPQKMHKWQTGADWSESESTLFNHPDQSCSSYEPIEFHLTQISEHALILTGFSSLLMCVC